MSASAQVASPNGPTAPPPADLSTSSSSMDDTFERDLREMLKDAPNLNDMSNTVQGGFKSEGKPQAYIRPDNQGRAASTAATNPIPRSQTVPPDTLDFPIYGKELVTSCIPGMYGRSDLERALANDATKSTSNIPLSSPERNGQNSGNLSPSGKPSSLVTPQASKLDTIRAWSVNTYKCTRQMISERLGKGSRTVDLELEAQIEALRDTQRKYANILRLARALTNHFYHVVQTQRALGDTFADLSQKSPELQNEFSYNSETQKTLCKNGETLLGALNFFTSSVNTLCNKTMEDTLTTIKAYEAARVEFDAYRTGLESLQLGPRDSATMPRIDDAQRKFQVHKDKYERLKADVAIKLKFLDENRVKVMHKQLLLFHNAIAAYFCGNQTALEATLKQFNIKLKSPNSDTPSWLEQ